MHKSFIIPYRDRAEHLAILTPRLWKLFPHDEILVIEQGDDKPFNRAKLLNIGVTFSQGYFLVMHDVDKVPQNVEYDIGVYDHVSQLCRSSIQHEDYLGGVTVFPDWYFKEMLNGYSNEFWGWGGEDNEMAFRIKNIGGNIRNKFGKFKDLYHPPHEVKFDQAKWDQACKPRSDKDGYNNLEFELVKIENHDFYTKITVKL